MAIKLRFVTHNTLIAHVIRSGEMGFWCNHVEAITPDGKQIIGAYMDEGISYRPVDYDKTWSKQLIVTIPATEEQTKTFYDFLHSQLGKPYDIEAIGQMVLGVVTSEEDNYNSNNWICSAIQAAALVKAGIVKSLATDLHTTTPRDVLVMIATIVKVAEPEISK